MKFDVRIEVDLLTLYSTSSVQSNGKVDPKTNVSLLIDSYSLHVPNLIIRFGTCLNGALEKRTISYVPFCLSPDQRD